MKRNAPQIICGLSVWKARITGSDPVGTSSRSERTRAIEALCAYLRFSHTAGGRPLCRDSIASSRIVRAPTEMLSLAAHSRLLKNPSVHFGDFSISYKSRSQPKVSEGGDRKNPVTLKKTTRSVRQNALSSRGDANLSRKANAQVAVNPQVGAVGRYAMQTADGPSKSPPPAVPTQRNRGEAGNNRCRNLFPVAHQPDGDE
jgi:hypothetical protein